MAEATAKQDESFMKVHAHIIHCVYVCSYCTVISVIHYIMFNILQHSSVAQQEQQEKAWLRHKHALAKVKLERVRGLPCMLVYYWDCI